MNLCRKTEDGFVCGATNAKAQKLCPHHLMAIWEVFCQWCDDGKCGIGKTIFNEKKPIPPTSRCT